MKAGRPSQGDATSCTRAESGTVVNVGVKRRGYEEMIKFSLSARRGLHSRPCMAYYGRLDDGATSAWQDFGDEHRRRREAHRLKDLAAQGMKACCSNPRKSGRPARSWRSRSHDTNSSRAWKMHVYTRGRVANARQDYGRPRYGEFLGHSGRWRSPTATAPAPSDLVTGAPPDLTNRA